MCIRDRVRPDCEHFSWGFSVSDWVFSYPVYSQQEDKIRKRLEKLGDWIYPLTYEHMNEEGRKFFGEDEYSVLHGALWSAGGYQGHTVPGYPKLLRLGISGTLREIEEAEAKTGDEKKRELYRALTILMNGFSEWILKYAEKAEKLAAETQDGRLLKVCLLYTSRCV